MTTVRPDVDAAGDRHRTASAAAGDAVRVDAFSRTVSSGWGSRRRRRAMGVDGRGDQLLGGGWRGTDRRFLPARVASPAWGSPRRTRWWRRRWPWTGRRRAAGPTSRSRTPGQRQQRLPGEGALPVQRCGRRLPGAPGERGGDDVGLDQQRRVRAGPVGARRSCASAEPGPPRWRPRCGRTGRTSRRRGCSSRPTPPPGCRSPAGSPSSTTSPARPPTVPSSASSTPSPPGRTPEHIGGSGLPWAGGTRRPPEPLDRSRRSVKDLCRAGRPRVPAARWVRPAPVGASLPPAPQRPVLRPGRR